MTLRLQDAEARDEAAWRALWDGYLDFYAVALEPAITDHTWSRLMDPASPLKCRMAFRDGRMEGFVIHQHHPSSWVMGDDCYLEDLFVADSARGCGIGRALIEDLITLARAKGWNRLYWHTAKGNARARALYDSFTPSDDHVRYRLTL